MCIRDRPYSRDKSDLFGQNAARPYLLHVFNQPHGSLSPHHILLKKDGGVRLNLLSSCFVMQNYSYLERSPFTAPELKKKLEEFKKDPGSLCLPLQCLEGMITKEAGLFSLGLILIEYADPPTALLFREKAISMSALQRSLLKSLNNGDIHLVLAALVNEYPWMREDSRMDLNPLIKLNGIQQRSSMVLQGESSGIRRRRHYLQPKSVSSSNR
eukprot:TRINITY_DN16696_c0_g2_i1.p2 TRINITY_DN16696_c0_g2~~TRINITY_DN16696_c0_g2_i1.p2  ORF type:complete len:225 (-),score=23.14 TRINITY_DN16696_c0_g2_i1:894-1532(-)